MTTKTPRKLRTRTLTALLLGAGFSAFSFGATTAMAADSPKNKDDNTYQRDRNAKNKAKPNAQRRRDWREDKRQGRGNWRGVDDRREDRTRRERVDERSRDNTRRERVDERRRENTRRARVDERRRENTRRARVDERRRENTRRARVDERRRDRSRRARTNARRDYYRAERRDRNRRNYNYRRDNRHNNYRYRNYGNNNYYGYQGYRTNYRSSLGINFVFGNPGYSDYRWASTPYSFYQPGNWSYSNYYNSVSCQRINVVANHHGHSELISVNECYNPIDGYYMIQGSERLIDCLYD